MTVAEILLQMGQQQAAARRAQGDLWGNAIGNLSLLPGQISNDREAQALRKRALVIQDEDQRFKREDQGFQRDKNQRDQAAAVRDDKKRIEDATKQAKKDADEEQVKKIYTEAVNLYHQGDIMAVPDLATTTDFLQLQGHPDLLGKVVDAHKTLRKDYIASTQPDRIYEDPTKDVIDKNTGEVLRHGTPKQETQTPAEQALTAYARSLGKPNSMALTYADLKNYAKDEETIKTQQAFARHKLERDYDNANTPPVKDADQNKLEQQYGTVLMRAVSSRNGGLGGEDAKVDQANHLLGSLDQFFDPKTGDYNIPRVQLNELALGLAKLMAGNSQAGEGMMREFQQRTAKGDIAGALTYLTGQPVATNTQGITKMLRESIERQGGIAVDNREGYMNYIRGQAPTELDEARRRAREEHGLVPLRQSKVFTNKDGTKKLYSSSDGGKTWK